MNAHRHHDASCWDIGIALAVTRWSHLFSQQQESIAVGIGIEGRRLSGIIRGNKQVYVRAITSYWSSLQFTSRENPRSEVDDRGTDFWLSR
jgi:hypothetical protein